MNRSQSIKYLVDNGATRSSLKKLSDDEMKEIVNIQYNFTHGIISFDRIKYFVEKRNIKSSYLLDKSIIYGKYDIAQYLINHGHQLDKSRHYISNVEMIDFAIKNGFEISPASMRVLGSQGGKLEVFKYIISLKPDILDSVDEFITCLTQDCVLHLLPTHIDTASKHIHDFIIYGYEDLLLELHQSGVNLGPYMDMIIEHIDDIKFIDTMLKAYDSEKRDMVLFSRTYMDIKYLEFQYPDFRQKLIQYKYMDILYKSGDIDNIAYLFKKYHIPITGETMTETCRSILDRMWGSYIETSNGDIEDDIEYCRYMATFFSPNFTMSPFIAYLDSLTEEHKQAEDIPIELDNSIESTVWI